jgi:tight adherence protein B
VTAIDLAFAAGFVMTGLCALVWLRRRRPGARLARLSRDAAAPSSVSSGVLLSVPKLNGRAAAVLTTRPVASLVAVVALAGGAALLIAGPVAAVVAALYASVAVLGGHRHLVRRAADRALSDLLDVIDAAAGDLRAGIVPGGPIIVSDRTGRPNAAFDGAGRRDSGADRAADRFGTRARAGRREDAAVQVAMARLDAAHRISEALGTPLADLLDRVDADLRAGQALRVNVAAQTSGAQVTTVLLVGLPVVGLWIGAGIGADPVGQLLHTPLGAACAIVAVALQCAGLLWTGRMVHAVTTEVRC